MKHVSELWIETGRVTRTAGQRRFIPAHEICKSFGPSFCTILHAVHALDGYLSIVWNREEICIKTVQDIGPDAVLDLSELYGNDYQETHRAGRKFIAALYDPKQKAWRYHGSLTHISLACHFWGHRQTLQTQIRRSRKRRLIRVYTVCLKDFM